MSSLDRYQDKYENLHMTRQDGILEVAMHTGGGPLIWSAKTHVEFGEAFRDIASDPENRVVILTGTGETYCAEGDLESFQELLKSPAGWAQVYTEGRRLYEHLLDIPVPVVGVVNGPATAHAALALLSDVVLAADTAVFQDHGHFNGGIVPGDGVHILWPLLLGMNRGRYFLLTAQKLSAQEALALGVVNEVMPLARLRGRAHELAGQLAKQSPVTLRLTRVALTLQVRRLFQDDLGYGLALEAVSGIVLAS
jgi:enoyl-CoA hydratase/carnithine racemase